MKDFASPWRGRRMAGLLMIIVGTAFLLDQSDIVAVQDLWHYWPLLLVAAGIYRMGHASDARAVTSGLWSVLVGLWLFANVEGWFGMDFNNSWPFLLVAWGVTLLLRPGAMAGSRRRSAVVEDQERHHAP